MTTLSVEDWPIEQVIPYARNPRKNAAAVAKVAASLKEFGWRQPIVVDKERVIIVGHTRLLAAQKLGMSAVPVHVATNLTPAQVKAYRLADNRTNEEAEWDGELLGLELGDLSTLDFDLSLTGFDSDEIAAFTMEPRGEESEDVDLTPPEKPKSERGVVYQLGRHRVMCGDSTENAAWDSLMADAVADMVWTDPPYGVAYVGGTADALEIENDNLDGPALTQFLRDALSLAWAHSREGAAWYVAGPALSVPLHAFAVVLMELDVWRHTLIWVKSAFALGRADYHYRHEALFYGWKKGAPRYFTDDRTQDSVWEFAKPRRNADHPTMKPADLVRRAIENSSKPSWIVVDAFAGSGTTLIACEQSGRTCYAMELDPGYCDVIRRRYSEFVNDPSLAP